jgi:hypothetical protein
MLRASIEKCFSRKSRNRLSCHLEKPGFCQETSPGKAQWMSITTQVKVLADTCLVPRRGGLTV